MSDVVLIYNGSSVFSWNMGSLWANDCGLMSGISNR